MDKDTDQTKAEKRQLAKEEENREKERKLILNKLKKLFFYLFGVLIILGISYKTYKYFSTPEGKVNPETLGVSDSEWIRGDRNSKAILVEYGDFQCPACANYFPLVEKLSEEIKDNFAFIYRNFPLTQIHPNALPAAKAAEAAGVGGKFWEMYSILYEKQSDWAEDKNAKDKFIGYAKEIGLDENQFIKDFESKEVEDAINSDIAGARSLSVNATPTFYLNGKKIQPRSYDEFKKLVEEEIKGYKLE